MNCEGAKIGDASKPGVSRRALLRMAGTTWIAVSVLLNGFSYSWLRTGELNCALLAAGVGFVFALLIHHFGFLRVADKNVARIRSLEGRRSVFAFMSGKSYILVFVMIFMGFLLRHSPIPKFYLAVLYTAIGMALFLSSLRYFRYSRS